MAYQFATIFALCLAAYAAAGIAFGLFFVTKAIGKVDAAAEHGSWWFRLLILPGVAALWPLMLRRWAALRRGR